MAMNILIADDHGVLRAGLVALLNYETGFAVIGEAESSEEAIRLAAENNPDLVLMDLNMPEIGGIEATRRIRKSLPNVRVLILTLYEDVDLVREAIQAGADGYILKRAVKTELIGAIQTVMRGDLYVHPAMMRALLAEPGPETKPASTLAESLTPREVDVLRLIVRGHTNSQIAEILSLSVRTVEYHRANLTGKLNLHSRVDLIRYAAENGIA
jgi:two-component system, NarL family, response regulator NreC